MINKLYDRYFQKSFTFLYPLLGFPKSKELQPKQVYLTWSEKIDIADRKLICFYERHPDNQNWVDFEMNQMLNHSMLDFCESVDEDRIVYVFDMNSMADDFDKFLKGKYSTMSPEAKEKIADYFGVKSPEFVYIESFLYPDKYHRVYAEILGVKLKMVQESHELCNIYDPERENFYIRHEVIKP